MRMGLWLVGPLLGSLVGCATATATPANVEPDLATMTKAQRVDFLSETFQHSAKYGPYEQKRRLPLYLDQAIPTYRAMLQQDGALFSAEMYALTLGNEVLSRHVTNAPWLRTIWRQAQADSDVITLYKSHAFPDPHFPYGFWFGEYASKYNVADLENDLTKGLKAAALQGDGKACDALLGTPIQSEIAATCSTAATDSRAAFNQTLELDRRDAVARQEAIRRAEADHQRDIAHALDVQHACAAVGVATPNIDMVKARSFGGDINNVRPQGKINDRDNASSVEAYIVDMEDAYIRGLEGAAVRHGVAITPYLTPQLYIWLVSPQCGINK